MTTYKTTFTNGKTTKVEKRGNRFFYRNSLGRMIPIAKKDVEVC